MKVLWKKKVCRSREQCTGHTEKEKTLVHVLKKEEEGKR